MNKIALVMRNPALTALMLGHFTNDLLVGVLPILYPVIKVKFGIDNAAVGLITLAYAGAGALFQPAFGYITDAHFRRWMPTFVICWAALFVSLYGFALSYPMLIVLAALGGLASAAFHPLGASTAALVSDPRNRNISLSMYTVGGTVGYAIGPLVAVLLVSMFGEKGTGVLLIPGVIVALLIWRQMGPVLELRRTAAAAQRAERTGARVAWFDLGRIILVTMLRSWSFLALLQFIPVWFDGDLGYHRAFYGAISTTMIVSGALGTLAGGALADRIGGKWVIVGSQILCVPALLLFAQFPGPASFVIGFAFGFCSDASLAVTLEVAQRLIPGRAGVASGIVFGLGFITGGIGVPITGWVADHHGFPVAISMLAGLCVLAAVVGFTLPGRIFQPVAAPVAASA